MAQVRSVLPCFGSLLFAYLIGDLMNNHNESSQHGRLVSDSSYIKQKTSSELDWGFM